MHTNPKENPSQPDPILIEQFRRKGYRCEEVKQEDATILILRHEKKTADFISQIVNETYKDLLRGN